MTNVWGADANDEAQEEYQRVPPQAMEAEICVLGSMLKSREKLQDAICDINVDWFYRPANQTLFNRMKHMASIGVPVDAVTFRQALVDADEYENIGGQEYFLELITGVPDASSIAHYADIIRNKASKRAMIVAGAEMIDKGYDQSIRAEVAIGEAYTTLQEIMAQEVSDADVGITEAMDDALGHAERVVMGEEAPGLKTGYRYLDVNILSGGFREGETIVIAADTSVGKTVVGCDFARKCCNTGFGAVIASAEMPARELANRLLSAESGVTINTIRSGKYTEREMNAIHEARKRMETWDLHILEGNRTIADIAASCKRINARWNGNLKEVVVDYLQIMIPEDMTVNRELQVGTMALRCKQAANQMRIPWIMMAQFNRGHSAMKKPPQMSNLRDSGQIEQHANIVILLHPLNERKMEPGTPEEGLGYYEIGMFVPKNRNGMTHSSWDNAIIRKVRRFCGRTEAGDRI